MGGGNAGRYAHRPERGGLSPRGRGKPEKIAERHATPGSIPAWAGETLSGYPAGDGVVVYPRVGGGNNVAGRRRLPP